MISMTEQKYIKQLYEDGVSKSEIQRRTKRGYRTVCKYADKEDWNDERQPNLDPDSYPVLGRFIPIIDEWLEGDTRASRKQRHTAKRIYDRLRTEAGYTGGYSSVKRYVRKKRFVLKQGLVGCLPLAHPMAFAQVDFGEFQRYDAAGDEHKAYELVMSFPYSDKAFVQVFPSQNQECLQGYASTICPRQLQKCLTAQKESLRTALQGLCSITALRLISAILRPATKRATSRTR